MTERRKLERFKLRVPARIEVVTQDRDVEETPPALNLTAENICSCGAFFHTSSPLPEGTEVKIDMVLDLDPEGTEVKIDMVLDLDEVRGLEGRRSLIAVPGRVLRSEPTGMAICFGKDYEILPSSDA
jgi:hypothetical protein